MISIYLASLPNSRADRSRDGSIYSQPTKLTEEQSHWLSAMQEQHAILPKMKCTPGIEKEQLKLTENIIFHFMKVEDFYVGTWHKVESLMISDAIVRKINNRHFEKSKVFAGKEAIRIVR